jgi:hypothetical protein
MYATVTFRAAPMPCEMNPPTARDELHELGAGAAHRLHGLLVLPLGVRARLPRVRMAELHVRDLVREQRAQAGAVNERQRALGDHEPDAARRMGQDDDAQDVHFDDPERRGAAVGRPVPEPRSRQERLHAEERLSRSAGVTSRGFGGVDVVAHAASASSAPPSPSSRAPMTRQP